MRGTVAKRMRSAAKDGEGVVNRKELKRIKKLYRAYNTEQFPKLVDTRWQTSPLKFARGVQDGLHQTYDRPVRSIGNFFAFLSKKGKGVAINIARVAGRIPSYELRNRVAELKGNQDLYEPIPEPTTER